MIVPASVAVFVTVFGLFVDARRPRFDWKSEYEPVKRSVSVTITVFSGFAIVLAGVLATAVAGAIGAIIFSVALVAAAWFLFGKLSAAPLRE